MRLIKQLCVFIIVIFSLVIFNFNIFFAIASNGNNSAVNQKGSDKIVKVGFPIQEGLTEIEPNGNYSGYTFDYLQMISLYTGWTFKYITPEGDLNTQLATLLTMLDNGEIDVLGGIKKAGDISQRYLFPERDYGTAYLTLSVLETNITLSEENFFEYAKKHIKIAVRKGAKKSIAKLTAYCDANKFNYEIIECELKDFTSVLSSGEADVALSVDLSKIPGTKIINSFAGEPYYLAVKKGAEEIVSGIDEAILKQEKTDPYFQKRLYDKYFGETRRKFILTDEEKTLISQMPILKVLIATEAAPFQYSIEKNVYAGISISFLNDITQKTGIKFKFLPREQNIELIDDIKNKNIDFVLGIPYDFNLALKNDLILTQPYTQTETTVFAKRKFDINNTKGKILALPNGATILPEFGDENIKYYNNLEECIKAVDSGKADYCYGNSYSVSYYLSKGVYANEVLIQLPTKEKAFCFGFNKLGDTTLLTVFNRIITTTTEYDMYSYLLNELAILDKSLSLWEYIKLNPIATLLIGAIVMLAAMLIFIYIIKSKQKEQMLKTKNNAKVRFLSNMSHEMRTPLHTIIGLNYLQSQNKSMPNSALDSCNKIDTSARHLLSIINDVLDIAKIDEGKLTFNQESFNLYSLLNEIIMIYGEQSKQKNIEFISQFSTEINCLVVGDKLRIKQVLINLITNAIKYNKDNGKINFTVNKLSEDEEFVSLEFIVIDTGKGIETNNLSRIFLAFEREERNSNCDGVGLGLAISNSILKLMNSELKVVSKINEGSAFSFVLKLPKSKDNIEVTEKFDIDKIDFTNCNILLAEDNNINASIVSNMLKAKNANIEIAENGKIAYEKFLNSKENYYKVILMDIRMPIMDGLQCAKAIREIGRKDAKKIAIIALSANAFTEDINKSIDAGMNAHLAKPIEPQKIYQIINKLIFKEEKDE